MNKLILGTAPKAPFIQSNHPFLIIDDGEIIDALPRPKRRQWEEIDFSTHSFNPLKGMNYTRAREFVSVLDAVFPEGAQTLTHKASNFILLKALLEGAPFLDKLIEPSNDPHQKDAYDKIQTFLLSPVLNRVLNHPTNFSFNQTIYARLNRAELGDFDCFVLGNLLISQYKGQVIIPDFGFYGSKTHMALIRQSRLIAGLTSLDEAQDFRSQFLLMDVDAYGCTYEDAVALTDRSGWARHSNGYEDHIHKLMTVPKNLTGL